MNPIAMQETRQTPCYKKKGDLGEAEVLEVLQGQAAKELHFTFNGFVNNDGDRPLVNLTGAKITSVVDRSAWIAIHTELAVYRTESIACRSALLAWCKEIAEGKTPGKALRLRGENKGAGFQKFNGPPGVRLMRVPRTTLAG
jgi:hypothetical protein